MDKIIENLSSEQEKVIIDIKDIFEPMGISHEVIVHACHDFDYKSDNIFKYLFNMISESANEASSTTSSYTDKTISTNNNVTIPSSTNKNNEVVTKILTSHNNLTDNVKSTNINQAQGAIKKVCNYNDKFAKVNEKLDIICENIRHYIQNTHILIIMRGLPGSGKTTNVFKLTQYFEGMHKVCSADTFFIDRRTGVYKFDGCLLPQAHNYCQTEADLAVQQGIPLVIIDNTNLKLQDFWFYINLAVCNNYCIGIFDSIVHWKNDVRKLEQVNAHRVPRETIARMKENSEMYFIEEIVTRIGNYDRFISTKHINGTEKIVITNQEPINLIDFNVPNIIDNISIEESNVTTHKETNLSQDEPSSETDQSQSSSLSDVTLVPDDTTTPSTSSTYENSNSPIINDLIQDDDDDDIKIYLSNGEINPELMLKLHECFPYLTETSINSVIINEQCESFNQLVYYILQYYDELLHFDSTKGVPELINENKVDLGAKSKRSEPKPSILDDTDSVFVKVDRETASNLSRFFGTQNMTYLLSDISKLKQDDLEIEVPAYFAQQLHSFWLESLTKKYSCNKSGKESSEDAKIAYQLAGLDVSYPDTSLNNIKLQQRDLYLDSIKLNEETYSVADKLKLKNLVAEFPLVDSKAVEKLFLHYGKNSDLTRKGIIQQYGIDNNKELEKNAIEQAQKHAEDIIQEEMKKLNVSDVLKSEQHDSLISLENTERDLIICQAQDYRLLCEKMKEYMNQYKELANQAYLSHKPLDKIRYDEMVEIFRRQSEKSTMNAIHCLFVSNPPNVIDLHYLNAKEATVVLEIFIDNCIDQLRDKKKTHETIFIITGWGKNSVNNVAILRPLVIKILKRRNISFEKVPRNAGAFRAKIYSGDTKTNEQLN